MIDLGKEMIAASKPRTQTAKVCVDGELHERVNDLTRQLFEERQAGSDDMGGSTVAREIEELLDEAEGRTYFFRFAAVGRDEWKRLKDTNAPSVTAIKTAREKGRTPPPYTENFWPEAIAASLTQVRKATDPEDAWQDVSWDAAKVREITASWNDAQWKEITAGCEAANEGESTLPSRNSGSVRMLLTGGRSEPQEQSGGPDQLSMAEGSDR